MSQFNINTNKVFSQLQELINKNIYSQVNVLPQEIIDSRKKAYDTFKLSLFFEEVIDEAISFSKKVVWENPNENIYLASTAEELVEIFKLRSDVFHNIGYQDIFCDTIEGLNFDIYDKKSAIAYYKRDNVYSATIRLIFDSEYKLPSDSVHSFDDLRSSNKKIGEISRNVVKHTNHGLNLEFRYLMGTMFKLVYDNNLDLALSGLKKEHYKLFNKFGDVNIIKELDNYGGVDEECLIVSYNPSKPSKFFQKAFLRK